MRFDVVTLFPELFEPHLIHGITRRAYESAQVDVRLWPLRDFATASPVASMTGPTAAARAWCCWPSPWSGP